MAIKTLLENLRDYYMRTRAVGHTRLMIDGASGFEREHLVVGLFVQRDFLRRHLPKKSALVTLKDIEDRTLVSQRAPIAFDNAALDVIFAQALSEICSLEAQVHTLKLKLKLQEKEK